MSELVANDAPESRSSLGWPTARVATTGISGLLCLVLSACYLGRPDAFAAITVFPIGMWLVPGLALALAGIRRRGNRPVAAAITAWLIFFLALAEEPWSLLRLVASPGSGKLVEVGQGESIRVVSLNCNIGSPQAVEEVGQYHPDIVLLQESPGRGAMEALGKKLFGAEAGIVSGVDASLIVRGGSSRQTWRWTFDHTSCRRGSLFGPGRKSRWSVPGSFPPCSAWTSGRRTAGASSRRTDKSVGSSFARSSAVSVPCP
jgi:hypothetical protein